MSGGDRLFCVTGATGFLGGFIAAGLLSRGHRVVLPVRPRGGDSPGERVDRLLSLFGLHPESRPEVVEGHVERPELGLPSGTAERLRSEVDEVIHCAADTSFAARREEAVMRTNVEGLRNVFRLLSGCSRFHYLSTAYVAGRREGICREELEEVDDFHNGYERSKYLAEREISRLCGEAGVRLAIYRPTIVYGHSESGMSLGFRALYQPLRVILTLRERLAADLRSGDGGRASALGVSIAPDGRMRMPLVMSDGGGAMDLLPVDHFTAALFALMEEREGGVYHITGPPGGTSLERIVELLRECYGVEGIETIEGGRGRPPNPLERLMDGFMELYYPYVRDRRVMDTGRSAPPLERAGISCPGLTPDVFRRCMDYAMDAGWRSPL